MADRRDLMPGHVWEAYAAPGKPWCVSGTDDDLSVNLYFSKKGRLKGVLVFDNDTEESVIIGKVPKKERESA